MTPLNSTFTYIATTQPKILDNGDIDVSVSLVSSVRGSIQPISGNETIPAVAASRNTGTIKIYASERLTFRKDGGNGSCYVWWQGSLYELVDEMAYVNVLKHFKYIACLVPIAQIPECVKEVIQ
jgi:hypothetical protein